MLSDGNANQPSMFTLGRKPLTTASVGVPFTGESLFIENGHKALGAIV
ncbi:MAG: hypothetical protein H6649_02340 [Caldilineae bacterium]|nr:hypothetical protein [Caldilineae bacterium]